MAGSAWNLIRNSTPEHPPAINLVSASDLFIVNSDALTVAADIDDPIELAQSGAGTAIRPFCSKGYPFVDLFLISGHATTAPTIPATTVCKVRAFGRAPYNNRQVGKHLLPSDIDSAVFDALGSAAVGGSLYIPLYSDAGVHEQAFLDTPEINSNSVDTKRFQVFGGPSYFTKGYTDILIAISQALVQINATKAIVLGALGSN